MMQSFDDLVLGDVLIAPFVTYAAVAFVVMLLLRPVLAKAGFDLLFSAPPIAMLRLYVLVLALLIMII